MLKVRGQPSTTMSFHSGPSGGPFNYYQYSTLIPEGSYEWISYENTGKKRFGNCSHYKHVGVNVTTPVVWPWGGSTYYMSATWPWMHSLILLPADNHQCTPAEIIALNSNAFETMKPSMGNDSSLLQFLAELKDIKSLFKLFNRNKSAMYNLASGNLNYQFGWKPFLSDLFQIYERLTNFKVNLERYKSQQGKMQRRHFRKTVYNGHCNAEHSEPYTYFWREGTRVTTFNATMLFTYTIPNVDTVYADVLAFLDTTGFKITALPKLAWELIPFSFVIDWFFDVQGFFEQFDKDELDSVVTIHDYCYTLKTDIAVKYYRSINDDGHVPHHLGSSIVKKYDRVRGIPVSSLNNEYVWGVKESGKYGAKQFVLSASLLTVLRGV